MIKIVNELHATQLQQLMKLYEQCWWIENRKPDDVQRMLQRCDIVGIVDEQQTLIAFTRILSDGMYKAFLFDVIVDEQYRGKQLGLLLMNAVMNHPSVKDVQHVELYCKEDMIPFYQKWNFEDTYPTVRFMRKKTINSLSFSLSTTTRIK